MRLIAHRISKTQHSRETSTFLREELLPATGTLAEGLLKEVRNAIVSRNPVAGRFTREAGTIPAFEQRLQGLLENPTDEAFLSFTSDATKLLATRMSSEPFSTGGYVVFIEQIHDGVSYLFIVLLSTRAHPSFDEKLNLIASVSLDFEHLRHAVRLKLAEVPKNEDGVAHFVSRRADETSDYFRDFLGCEALSDSAAQGILMAMGLAGCATSQPRVSNSLPLDEAPKKLSVSKQATVAQLTRYELGSYRYPVDGDNIETAVVRSTIVPTNSNDGSTAALASPSYEPVPRSAELAVELAMQRDITNRIRAIQANVAATQQKAKEQYGFLVSQSEALTKLRAQLEADRQRLRELESQPHVDTPKTDAARNISSPASTSTKDVKW